MGCSLADTPDHRVSRGLAPLSISPTLIQEMLWPRCSQGDMRLLSFFVLFPLQIFVLFPAKLCFLGLGVISPTSWITFLPLCVPFRYLILVFGLVSTNDRDN